MQQLEGQLEVEQEKLATLVRNLAMDGGQQKQNEDVGVSEEWIQSLKERRKVSSPSPSPSKLTPT